MMTEKHTFNLYRVVIDLVINKIPILVEFHIGLLCRYEHYFKLRLDIFVIINILHIVNN